MMTTAGISKIMFHFYLPIWKNHFVDGNHFICIYYLSHLDSKSYDLVYGYDSENADSVKMSMN